MATWTVSANNDTTMTAYIAARLAQDGATITLDQAITELLSIAGIQYGTPACTISGPGVRTHGGRFV